MNGVQISIDGQKQPESYDDESLEDSVCNFLNEYPNSILSSPESLSKALIKIETSDNPPLETIWFYSAVSFYNAQSGVLLPPPAKLLLAKELFKWFKSLSYSCNVAKRVAVLAPVLYILYQLEINFSAIDPCLREEIRILLEKITRYISICCAEYVEVGEEGFDSMWEYILDVIRVWIVDEVREANNGDLMALFFPVLNDEYQQEVSVDMGRMAGAVMNEAFLLRLSLKISQGVDKEDFQRVILALAIQTIKGFQNFYFFDMLFKMLLEPSLPVAALLSSEDSVLLHKVLYDAVVLVEYSFYNGKWVDPSDNHSKNLAILWVMVADRAIKFARDRADRTSVIVYHNAFCECPLVVELIKWTTIQAGRLEQDTIPDLSTPKALIKWLLILENGGVQVFDRTMSALLAKGVMFVDDESSSEETCASSNNATCKKRKEKELSDVPESRVKQMRRDEGNDVGSDDDMEFVG